MKQRGSWRFETEAEQEIRDRGGAEDLRNVEPEI